MIPFAVKVDGEETGRWVLAIQGERFLIVDAHQRFQWVPMKDCEFLKAATPETPRPVVAVQPRRKLDLVTPLNGG